MKQTILASLFALSLPLAQAAVSPETPFTIKFTKNNGQPGEIRDMTKYDDSSLGGGGELVFHATDKPPRQFAWQPDAEKDQWIECTAVIDADPLVSEVTYQLDKKSFAFEGKPVLSVVHVNCQLGPDEQHKLILTPVEDAEGYQKQLERDPLVIYDSGLHPELEPTDFERMVDIRFYVTDMTNTEYKWVDTTTPSSSHWAEWYPLYETLSEDEIVDMNGPRKEPSASVVGRQVFFAYQSEPKTFSWTLHKDDKEKKCSVHVAYDPHVSIVKVNLDNDVPTIDEQDQGDLKAISVTCENVDK